MSKAGLNYQVLITLVGIHLATIWGLVNANFSIPLLLVAIIGFYLRWLAFTCVVHRYFSHKVFKTSRFIQFLLAIWGTLTLVRSPIRFASGHRHHHLYSDTNKDLHSIRISGFFRSYIGWVIDNSYHEDTIGLVADLKKYPELVWLNKLYFLPTLLLLSFLYFYFGLDALVYMGLLPAVFTWHVAFAVTVLFHSVGEKTHETNDESRNSDVLGILLLGEGWHNNHHADMSCARLGLNKGNLDLGFQFLVLLEALGLIRSLRRVHRLERTPESKFIFGYQRKNSSEQDRTRDVEPPLSKTA